MKFLFLFFVIGCAVALPRSYYQRYAGAARLQAAARPRRAPVHRRTMLISGYYRPLFAQRRTGFEPETAMTAFATGDSVAAGSYLGTNAAPGCVSCDQENTEYLATNPEALSPAAEYDQTQNQEGEAPVADYPEAPVADPAGDELAEIAPPKPARTPKRKPSKKVQKPIPEDDEAEDEDEAVFPQRNRGPSNSFFPIVFGGHPSSRSGGGGGGAGGVTAIANSYSTGKGGVATSHATAYGGGPPSRPRKRTEQPDADDE